MISTVKKLFENFTKKCCKSQTMKDLGLKNYLAEKKIDTTNIVLRAIFQK